MSNRPSWDSYFISLAEVVRSRANCLRMTVGAVIVKDKRIIATGYNGTPSGITNCSEGGCERCLHRHQEILKPYEKKELCICTHAEQNAITQSAYHGISTKGGSMYVTVAPCLQCAKTIINAGIVEVMYKEKNSDDLGIQLLKQADVRVRLYIS